MQTQGRVDKGTGEHGCAAAEVSTGRKEDRLVGSTVLLNAWLILCHEVVQINQPNRPHRIPIHSIYVLTPTPATRVFVRAPQPATVLSLSPSSPQPVKQTAFGPSKGRWERKETRKSAGASASEDDGRRAGVRACVEAEGGGRSVY
jgi:hypothetical protein